jgi:hypothetical protein
VDDIQFGVFCAQVSSEPFMIDNDDSDSSDNEMKSSATKTAGPMLTVGHVPYTKHARNV